MPRAKKVTPVIVEEVDRVSETEVCRATFNILNHSRDLFKETAVRKLRDSSLDEAQLKAVFAVIDETTEKSKTDGIRQISSLYKG